MIRRALVDSAVPIYALGRPSELQEPCRRVLAAAAEGSLQLFASTEIIQEVVFHRLRVTGDRELAVKQGLGLAQLVGLLPFDQAVLSRALELTRTTTIGGRDAVHAATALLAGIDTIITPDPDFDAIAELTRLSPAQAI